MTYCTKEQDRTETNVEKSEPFISNHIQLEN